MTTTFSTMTPPKNMSIQNNGVLYNSSSNFKTLDTFTSSASLPESLQKSLPDSPVLRETIYKLSTSKEIQRKFLLNMSKMLPALAESITWHHFIHPRKSRPYSIKDLPEGAFPLTLQHRTHVLNGYRWGKSEKKIYLAHGWESNVAKLKHFINPLVDSGYQVIAFDMPAHGKSKHKNTNFRDWMDAFENIVRTYGKAHGIIAHSCGATMTINMLAQNPDLTPKKLCLIAPMLSAKTHIDVFSTVVGLPTYLIDMLISRLEQTTTLKLDETYVTSLVQTIESDGLICHDQNDKFIPYDYGKAIAKAWRNSSLVSSRKLGHIRILKNEAMINKIVKHTTQ